MSLSTLRIATRKSPLALWQARAVQQQLEQHHPRLVVQIVPLVTLGDSIVDRQLSKIGGKGLFVKELEKALLSREADIAVHSMKDVPAEFPKGLCLPVICQRAWHRDAFISPTVSHFAELPEKAKVGTSSLRRQSQLMQLRPDLTIVPLRGNVNTRLQKLDKGEFDAIVLAAAGLRRLDMAERIRHEFPVEQLLPAPGQGALGIECRQDDPAVQELIAPLRDETTTICLEAERHVSRALGGSCQVPLAVYAELTEHRLILRARIVHPTGQPLLASEATGDVSLAQRLAQQVIAELRAQGAQDLIEEVLAQS